MRFLRRLGEGLGKSSGPGGNVRLDGGGGPKIVAVGENVGAISADPARPGEVIGNGRPGGAITDPKLIDEREVTVTDSNGDAIKPCVDFSSRVNGMVALQKYEAGDLSEEWDATLKAQLEMVNGVTFSKDGKKCTYKEGVFDTPLTMEVHIVDGRKVIVATGSMPAVVKRSKVQGLLAKAMGIANVAGGANATPIVRSGDTLITPDGQEYEFPSAAAEIGGISLPGGYVMFDPVKLLDPESSEGKLFAQVKAEGEFSSDPDLKAIYRKLAAMKDLKKYEGSDKNYIGVALDGEELERLARHFSSPRISHSADGLMKSSQAAAHTDSDSPVVDLIRGEVNGRNSPLQIDAGTGKVTLKEGAILEDVVASGLDPKAIELALDPGKGMVDLAKHQIKKLLSPGRDADVQLLLDSVAAASSLTLGREDNFEEIVRKIYVSRGGTEQMSAANFNKAVAIGKDALAIGRGSPLERDVAAGRLMSQVSGQPIVIVSRFESIDPQGLSQEHVVVTLCEGYGKPVVQGDSKDLDPAGGISRETYAFDRLMEKLPNQKLPLDVLYFRSAVEQQAAVGGQGNGERKLIEFGFNELELIEERVDRGHMNLRDIVEIYRTDPIAPLACFQPKFPTALPEVTAVNGNRICKALIKSYDLAGGDGEALGEQQKIDFQEALYRGEMAAFAVECGTKIDGRALLDAVANNVDLAKPFPSDEAERKKIINRIISDYGNKASAGFDGTLTAEFINSALRVVSAGITGSHINGSMMGRAAAHLGMPVLVASTAPNTNAEGRHISGYTLYRAPDGEGRPVAPIHFDCNEVGKITPPEGDAPKLPQQFALVLDPANGDFYDAGKIADGALKAGAGDGREAKINRFKALFPVEAFTTGEAPRWLDNVIPPPPPPPHDAAGPGGLPGAPAGPPPGAPDPVPPPPAGPGGGLGAGGLGAGGLGAGPGGAPDPAPPPPAVVPPPHDDAGAGPGGLPGDAGPPPT